MLGSRFYYGGQAVIEGVMMRGRNHMATAVRRPDGEIITMSEPLGAFSTSPLRRLPFLRGNIVLVETMILGLRALLYSADISLGEETKASPGLLWGTAALGFVFALSLFLVLPLALIRLIDPYLSSDLVSNTLEGIIRLGLFLIYLKAITLMPDIRRVFAYHGAEHKAINAYEAGEAMEVAKVKQYSTAHARCGTGFLLIVMVIAIIAFTFLGRPPLWLRFLSRIALLPIIAAIGYEAVRFAAGHRGNRVLRAILAPSLALQTMTTHEPDEQQLEVAISALNTVLAADT